MLSRLSLGLHHRTLSKSHDVTQGIIACRSMHLASPIRTRNFKIHPVLNLSKHRPVFGAAFIRFASTKGVGNLDHIPDAPIPHDPVPFAPIPSAPIPHDPELLDVVQTVGEPSFTSLGLGSSYTPVGLIQQAMEWMHIGCGVPWWGTIIIGTICVRTIIFPLVILAQRNAAKMNNNLPQMQFLQMKMTEARQSGNALEASRYAQELMLFMKEKQLSPLKNMLVPLAQAPLFVSFFVGLRGMANAPVDSMREGGLWWFTDLTVPDQYFLLPVLTSLTMWCTIELGTDTAKLSASNMGMIKYVLRAIPIVMLPFTISFPGAILCYWVSTNFISLIQVGFLKIPRVRAFFKIEKLITHKPEELSIKDKGFVGGFKDSWTNMKITKQLEERERMDELQFQRAGKVPIQKTYRYNPIKQAPLPTEILAKKR